MGKWRKMHFLIPCFVLDFTSTGALPLRCLFKSSGLLLVWFSNVFKGLLGTAKLQKVLKNNWKRTLSAPPKYTFWGALLAASWVLLGCLWCASWMLRACFSAASWVLLWWLWGAFGVPFGCSFEVPSEDQTIHFPVGKWRKIEDNTFFDTYFVSAFISPGALRPLCLFKSSWLLRVWSFGACWERPNYKKYWKTNEKWPFSCPLCCIVLNASWVPQGCSCCGYWDHLGCFLSGPSIGRSTARLIDPSIDGSIDWCIAWLIDRLNYRFKAVMLATLV